MQQSKTSLLSIGFGDQGIAPQLKDETAVIVLINMPRPVLDCRCLKIAPHVLDQRYLIIFDAKRDRPPVLLEP
ncbi:hypothetical protein D3C84_1025830 [compost metagenome]